MIHILKKFVHFQKHTSEYIILFQKIELQPYKYAGYKQLIKTIRLETSDDQLFSKSTMLLTAATELAYHTVKCSALNAEELNRENGFVVRVYVTICLPMW